MRKSFLILSFGLLALASLCFYAEQKQRSDKEQEAAKAIREVLKAQNQALAGRIFDGMRRTERDALLTLQRWKKKAKIRSFLTDTALTEPEAPRWMIVDGRRIRAAGVVDDALLEDALEEHLKSPEQLSLYHSKGKYYLFVKGSVDQTTFASAYVPEAFFAAIRSEDGIRVWLALKDGTVVYHPLNRFIGSNAANLKPVAAGIQEIEKGVSAPFVRTYLGLEGKEAYGSWTPLPSLGVMVGSEWPKSPFGVVQFSFLFWSSLGFFFLGALFLGFSFRRTHAPQKLERIFDESRLDEEALEYLESARSTAQKAIDRLKEKENEIAHSLEQKEEAVQKLAALERRLSLLEDYQNKVLPKVTGKQVWSELCELFSKRNPQLLFSFYRYSPSTFSLVPESLHGKGNFTDEARGFLQENRIYVGNPSYLSNLENTQAFQRWNGKRGLHMSIQDSEIKVYPIQCAGVKGAILIFFDRRMNVRGELEFLFENMESLVSSTGIFCDSLGHLLQSLYAKGSAWTSMASAPNHSRNRPKPS